MNRLRFILVLPVFAVISLILGITSTKAFADERGGQRNRQRNDRVEQRGWDKREHIAYRGEKYEYHEGRFYRPGLFGVILDLVLPPRGIVVTYLPTGYRTIIIGRTTYYEYENIYYQPSPGGYTVVQPPVMVTQYVSSPVVYAPAPNIAVPAAQPQPVGGETIIVNVPTATRGTIAITLIRYSNGFVGPQGELYSTFPSTEELNARYGR